MTEATAGAQPATGSAGQQRRRATEIARPLATRPSSHQGRAVLFRCYPPPSIAPDDIASDRATRHVRPTDLLRSSGRRRPAAHSPARTPPAPPRRPSASPPRASRRSRTGSPGRRTIPTRRTPGRSRRARTNPQTPTPPPSIACCAKRRTPRAARDLDRPREAAGGGSEWPGRIAARVDVRRPAQFGIATSRRSTCRSNSSSRLSTTARSWDLPAPPGRGNGLCPTSEARR